MRLPAFKKINSETVCVSSFGGVDRRSAPLEGSFKNMLNITADSSGALSSRENRGIMNFGGSHVYNMAALDILSENSVINKAFVVFTGSSLLAYYNDGGAFCSHNLMRTTGVLTAGRKQTVLSGTKMFFFPDGLYVNLMDMTDKKKLGYSKEQELGSDGEYFYELSLTRCDGLGNDNSEEGEYGRLECKYYSLNSDGTKGVFIGHTAVNAAFEKNDTVEIKGFSKGELNGYYKIYDIDAQRRYIIIKCPENDVRSTGSFVMRRRIPVMDHVIACGNRLWGCRYGLDEDGNSVNTIYASAEGDASNWYSLDGTAGGSWRGDVGCAGEFTGAVCYGGRPVFFKEDAIIKVFGTKPSDFSLSEVTSPGVENGSSGSIAAVGNELYYKSFGGIMRYDGSLPRRVDAALGSERMKNAVAGSLGDKYYVSMENSSGERRLYVYDTKSRIWHIEDDPGVVEFCRCSSELFMLCDRDGESTVYSVGGTYNSDADNAGVLEEKTEWMLESADIGFDTTEHKYVSKVTMRMALDEGASAEVQIAYDGEDVWHTEKVLRSVGDGIVTVWICPARCSYFNLRFRGKGGVRLYSVSRRYEKCSTYQKRRV